MKALAIIDKTREYLDYVERHILNVQKAWAEVQDKCSIPFVWDDYKFHCLNEEVKHHDLSKLGPREFVQYRQSFYPTDDEPKVRLGDAWEHHKDNNPHHWENWTTHEYANPYEAEMHCTHMVIDWLAMSYEFGDSPRQYYESNKERINLPKWAVDYIYELFDQLENDDTPRRIY